MNSTESNTRIIRTDALHDIANRLGAVIVNQRRQARADGDTALAEALAEAHSSVNKRILAIDVLDTAAYEHLCNEFHNETNARREALNAR